MKTKTIYIFLEQVCWDNNKELHGKMISGIPVISLNELMDKKESSAIIIMSKFHWQEIVE